VYTRLSRSRRAADAEFTSSCWLSQFTAVALLHRTAGVTAASVPLLPVDQSRTLHGRLRTVEVQ
jgi:hypothetical protein